MTDWMTLKLDQYQKWKLDQNEEKCLCYFNSTFKLESVLKLIK